MLNMEFIHDIDQGTRHARTDQTRQRMADRVRELWADECDREELLRRVDDDPVMQMLMSQEGK